MPHSVPMMQATKPQAIGTEALNGFAENNVCGKREGRRARAVGKHVSWELAALLGKRGAVSGAGHRHAGLCLHTQADLRRRGCGRPRPSRPDGPRGRPAHGGRACNRAGHARLAAGVSPPCGERVSPCGLRPTAGQGHWRLRRRRGEPLRVSAHQRRYHHRDYLPREDLHEGHRDRLAGGLRCHAPSPKRASGRGGNCVRAGAACDWPCVRRSACLAPACGLRCHGALCGSGPRPRLRLPSHQEFSRRARRARAIRDSKRHA